MVAGGVGDGVWDVWAKTSFTCRKAYFWNVGNFRDGDVEVPQQLSPGLIY